MNVDIGPIDDWLWIFVYVYPIIRIVLVIKDMFYAVKQWAPLFNSVYGYTGRWRLLSTKQK